jgi:hypothetical protein
MGNCLAIMGITTKKGKWSVMEEIDPKVTTISKPSLFCSSSSPWPSKHHLSHTSPMISVARKGLPKDLETTSLIQCRLVLPSYTLYRDNVLVEQRGDLQFERKRVRLNKHRYPWIRWAPFFSDTISDLGEYWNFKLRFRLLKNHFCRQSLFFASSSLFFFHRHWHRTTNESPSIQRPWTTNAV